ncbi:hypothetical protein FACS189485_20690 [Spirochaetia bacterium]|nr:hypothetical protein FACS189485_20690 [Spirochaetia bacterium]
MVTEIQFSETDDPIDNPMSESDLLQSAFCMQNKYTLVTHNIRHFVHIEYLSLEDWV